MFSNKNAMIFCFVNGALIYAIDNSLLVSVVAFLPLVFILPKGDWSGGFSLRAMRSYEGSSEEAMRFFGWVLSVLIFISMVLSLLRF